MSYPLDGRHLAGWLGKYDSLKRSYLGSFIGRIEASDGLRNLRYRGEALRIELLEWEREKYAVPTSRRHRRPAKKDQPHEP